MVINYAYVMPEHVRMPKYTEDAGDWALVPLKTPLFFRGPWGTNLRYLKYQGAMTVPRYP
jgi:hypothetical protein